MMKLGKLAPKFSAKTLKLSAYQPVPTVPPPPHKVWREYKVIPDEWDVFGNDEYGDCTVAAIAHMVMLFTAHTGAMVKPTRDDVLAAYSAITGFQAGPPPMNDNGAAVTDVLEYWRTTGIAGHKILGWAQVDQTNIMAIKQAVWLFGGVDLGVNLPNVAMTQADKGRPWTVVGRDGGLAGGHSVCNFGYGAAGTNCITWGKRQGMTWGWFKKYCDEAYAVITEDWIDAATKATPSGFNLAMLQADLDALKQLP